MEVVRSAAGHQRHLRAGRSTRVGAVVTGADAELLQRIEGHAHRAVVGGPELGVVDVDTVQRDIRLIGAAAADGAAARVDVQHGAGSRVGHGGVRNVDGARLEAEKADHVVGFERQCPDLLAGDDVAHRGVGRVDRGHFAGDVHGLAQRSDLEGDVELACQVHLQRHLVVNGGAEAAQLELHLVVAGRQGEQLIRARAVRHGRANRGGRQARRGHGDAGQRGALRIHDRPVQRCGSRLRPRLARRHADDGKDRRARPHPHPIPTHSPPPRLPPGIGGRTGRAPAPAHTVRTVDRRRLHRD